MAIHLTIRGLVQGVGYRQWFRRRALELGVSGWVRNRRDDTVEALIFAGDEAYEQLLRDAMNGPLGAKVDAIEEKSITFSHPEREQVEGFEIRPTV
ncbi:acylphosphatase [Phreatobacter sp.]|uniref:acylphosphatase n=1 Tax=Phreatobacter sp. TaxID=1966341 RepID=UPI003F6F62C0